MKNIKAIIVTKPIYGLEIDTVLKRNSNEENFNYNAEYAGDDGSYMYSNVELSEGMITKDNFAAIEWFTEKPLTNKEKIAQLRKECEELKIYHDKEKKLRIEAETQFGELWDTYKKLRDKVGDAKIEYKNKLAAATEKYNDSKSSIDVHLAVEEMTVSKNIIDLLNQF